MVFVPSYLTLVSQSAFGPRQQITWPIHGTVRPVVLNQSLIPDNFRRNQPDWSKSTIYMPLVTNSTFGTILLLLQSLMPATSVLGYVYC